MTTKKKKTVKTLKKKTSHKKHVAKAKHKTLKKATKKVAAKKKVAKRKKKAVKTSGILL